MLEQPLGDDDLVRHAELQRRMSTPICLDESITSVDRAEDMITLGSGRIVNIKPGRVGGFQPSRAIHDVCRAAGIPVWCGGMLESGIGRAYNVALASLPNFSLPGDLSPSARYWARDIVTPEWTMDAEGMVHVPTAPGLGVAIDTDFIESLTVQNARAERRLTHGGRRMTQPATLRRTLGFTDLMLHHDRHGHRVGNLSRAERRAARDRRRPSVAMLVWAAGGVLSLLGALTYAELGAMKPEAGGLYVYVRDTFGPLPAFLYGWTSFFVIASGSIATLAVAFSDTSPSSSRSAPCGASGRSVALIVLIAAINVRGTRKSATVQNWTTGAKVGVLLAAQSRTDHASARAAAATPITVPAEPTTVCRSPGLARR